MTGHGQSLVQNSAVRVLAEVRSVNNRFLKTHIHCDLNANRQSQLESLIKRFVNRGSLNLKIKLDRLQKSDNYRLNEDVIRAYWLQLTEIAGSSQHVNVESILVLPGVVQETISDDDSEIWPAVESAVTQALEKLIEMRALEGAVMKRDMLQNCDEISRSLDEIPTLAARSVDSFAQRMTDRITQLLEKHDITTQPADVIREVGIFAERIDISEEIVRLSSHVEQFRKICELDESSGRKLDFLVQEMLRETNTIGSKANDADIANHVIGVKTAIERIREMVQNVE
jgi:uncharacterized protein (TIGR00255 family)